MTNSVMLSINPKWCELIASGQKTIEVRKSKPKCDVPFKCYIYCTKGVVLTPCNDLSDVRNGKVIGEFICKNIDVICPDDFVVREDAERALEGSCISVDEFKKYMEYVPSTPLYLLKDAYAWNISDLVIYDKPKELSEFFHDCGEKPNCERCRLYFYESNEDGAYDECCSLLPNFKPLDRPPQSWMYVEEKK